jgi:hypothetical protein
MAERVLGGGAASRVTIDQNCLQVHFKLRGEKEKDPFVEYERSLFIGLYNMPELVIISCSKIF